MTTSPGEAAAGWAVGGMPRWRDLPHLAGIVARGYGAAPARARIVGAAWRVTAGSFWLLLLAAAHARGRMRATRHAVVIVDMPAPVTGLEAGLLVAIWVAMVLAVAVYEGVLVVLATAIGIGGGWVEWASLALLASLLIAEGAPAGRRAVRGWDARLVLPRSCGIPLAGPSRRPGCWLPGRAVTGMPANSCVP